MQVVALQCFVHTVTFCVELELFWPACKDLVKSDKNPKKKPEERISIYVFSIFLVFQGCRMKEESSYCLQVGKFNSEIFPDMLVSMVGNGGREPSWSILAVIKSSSLSSPLLFNRLPC